MKTIFILYLIFFSSWIMACTISCMISTVFIIGMIYFYNRTENSIVVKRYKEQLSDDLKQRYDRITRERMNISYQGYLLGLVLSLFLVFYNRQYKGKVGFSLVCTVTSICFLTNYFYYMLHPKSDWMLNHMSTSEEVHAWLQMYREMQYNYHAGFVLGIVAVGVFAFAFRC